MHNKTIVHFIIFLGLAVLAASSCQLWTPEQKVADALFGYWNYEVYYSDTGESVVDWDAVSEAYPGSDYGPFYHRFYIDTSVTGERVIAQGGIVGEGRISDDTVIMKIDSIEHLVLVGGDDWGPYIFYSRLYPWDDGFIFSITIPDPSNLDEFTLTGTKEWAGGEEKYPYTIVAKR